MNRLNRLNRLNQLRSEAKEAKNVSKNGSEFERFKSCLRPKGLRLTDERKAILKEIINTKGHFEAEDLLVNLRQQGLNISRATIYRSLPIMVKCGILREVSNNIDRHLRYEHISFGQHHDHLICLSCGHIVEFNDSTVERIQNYMCQKQNFIPRTHRMEIAGYCKECRKMQ